MSQDEFYSQLRQLVHREPFVPFVVQLRDGTRLVIKQPHVAFDPEGAGYVDLDDGALVDFTHDEVTSFGLLEQGAPA